MPRLALHPCTEPGCPALTAAARCPTHDLKRRYYELHPRGSSTQQGYGARWRKLRARVLAEESTCRQCGAPSTVADHIVPRRFGGTDERANLEGLCKRCHDTKTAREDGRWTKRSQ